MLDDQPPFLDFRLLQGRKRLRILVVEDNRDSAESMRLLLTLFGYEVTVVKDATASYSLELIAVSLLNSVVYGLLYRPLPYPDDSRIAMVHMHFSPQNARRGTLSMADFVDWRNRNTAFEKVAAFGFSRFTLTGGDQAERVAGAFVAG